MIYQRIINTIFRETILLANTYNSSKIESVCKASNINNYAFNMYTPYTIKSLISLALFMIVRSCHSVIGCNSQDIETNPKCKT